MPLQDILNTISENYYFGKASEWFAANKWHLFVVVLLITNSINFFSIRDVELKVEEEEKEIAIKKNERPHVFLSKNVSFDVINACANVVCYAEKCFCPTSITGDWFEMKDKCKSLFHGNGELAVFRSLLEWNEFNFISKENVEFNRYLWIGAYRVNHSNTINWIDKSKLQKNLYSFIGYGSSEEPKNCLMKGESNWVEPAHCKLNRYSTSSNAESYHAICKKKMETVFDDQQNIDDVKQFNSTIRAKLKNECKRFLCKRKNCYCYAKPSSMFEHWHAAHYHCQDDLGFDGLVWFESKTEQSNVISLGGNLIGMIGATNFLIEEEWMWLDDRQAIQQDDFQWDKNYRERQNRLCFSRNYYSKPQMIETSCSMDYRALCTFSGRLTATEERYIRVSALTHLAQKCEELFCTDYGKCYCITQENDDWSRVLQECHRIENADGTVIESEVELQFLQKKMDDSKYRAFWLGATDFHHQGKFSWINDKGIPQSRMTLKNVSSYIANSEYGNCLSLCAGCTYVDVEVCNRSKRMLCQISEKDILEQIEN